MTVKFMNFCTETLVHMKFHVTCLNASCLENTDREKFIC